MSNKRFGWIKQKPDQRDIPYVSKSLKLGNLPQLVDLRPLCPPIYDQGELGSCTANAIVAAYEFDQLKEEKVYTPLSRLFLYYNERDIEGTIDSDAGAELRDGVKSIAEAGICLEELWPYNIGQYPVLPPDSCYDNALNHQAIIYNAVQANVLSVQTVLADGYPVVFGFTVYESFEDPEVARTGIMQMPRLQEAVIGGHAVLAVGYNELTQKLLVRNSWGVDWGLDGYFWMPFNYLHNLASDFWVIKSVE